MKIQMNDTDNIYPSPGFFKQLLNLQFSLKKTLKIPKGKSETVNLRTDNTMAKIKSKTESELRFSGKYVVPAPLVALVMLS